MRKEGYTILPVILMAVMLLMQAGPTSELNITPVALMSQDSNECLSFQNITHDYNYSQPSQDAFNISADLVNYCAEMVLYSSTLMLNDTQGVNVSSDQVNWRYGIGSNSSYYVKWEVTRDSTVAEGTYVTFEMHPTRDNCFENCTDSQNYSYNLTVPFGLVDVNACYGIENITDDYSPSQSSFNLSADLSNTCWDGEIHYPVGTLFNESTGMVSTPNGGAPTYGQMAYMIFENTSSHVVWHMTIDSTLVYSTNVTFSLQAGCWVYISSLSITSSYMQDCTHTTFDIINYTMTIGATSNQTGNEAMTVNHVVLVDTPPHPEWGWNYSYQTEVDHLQMDVNYSAVILIKGVGDDEWGGLDWWWDIDWEGGHDEDNNGYHNQYEYTFSLLQGCYYINASLYERNDLYADEENAAVLAFDHLDFIVGNADCGDEENDSDGDGVSDSDDNCPNTAVGTIVDTHGCQYYWPERIFVWPDDVGGYDTAQNYSLIYNSGDNISVQTLYELDNLVNNVTYMIEWHISNSSGTVIISSGNFTTNSTGNTGYSTPLPNASLNLSDGCYIVRAELHDDTGQLLDHDEFLLCIYDGSNTANNDSDGDGVLDGDDDCPNTAAGTAVDSHGCPEGVTEPGADNGSSDDEESGGKAESGFVPGFTMAVGICAIFGAALTRRKSAH